MIIKRSLPSRRTSLWVVSAFALAGAATLLATFPTGVTVVTLDEPPPYPCTGGNCTYFDGTTNKGYSTARWDGCDASASAGASLLAGEDFDGDGNEDLVVGAPAASSSKGKVYVVYGSASAPASTLGLCGTGTTSFTGKTAGDLLGQSLASADLNNDGKLELIIGAPQGSSAPGVVYVIPGATGRWSAASDVSAFPGVKAITGAVNGDKLGYAVAAGDATGDGNADVLLGAPGVSKAYLRWGTSSGVTAGVVTDTAATFAFEGTSGEVGAAVAIVESLNAADSIKDIIIGAPKSNSGGGRLFMVEGRGKESFLGFAPSGAVSLATAWYHKMVILGDLEFSGTVTGEWGASIGGAGDVNQDGYNDLIVGAPKAPSPTGLPEAGRAYVILGSSSIFDSDKVLTSSGAPYFYGESTYDHLGSSVSSAGNVDNDLYPDLLVGAVDFDGSGTNGYYGAAYILAGRKQADWAGLVSGGPASAGIRLTGKSGSVKVGQAVFGRDGFDLDSDGYDDLLVTSPGHDVGTTTDAGRVWYLAMGDFYDKDLDLQTRAQGDCGVDDKDIAYKADGSTEKCDSKDNDCDGKVDDADSPVTGQKTYYQDNDGDGYGSNLTKQSCSSTPPAGYASSTGDCDDSKNTVKPGATEICDSIDNDCDTYIDDADSGVSNQNTYFADGDGDTYGNPSVTKKACSSTPPTGHVANSLDCDDTKPAVKPGAQELCDTIDNDCDSLIDDQDPTVSGQNVYCLDSDKDGYGTSGTTSKTCSSSPPTNYTSVCTDCNDSSATINTAAKEVCDSVDNDCDTWIDDADSNVTGQNTYYEDKDSDKYGNAAAPKLTCAATAPSGTVSNNTDCLDSNGAVNPAAKEICDGVDNDCDGKIDAADDSAEATTYYRDLDTDGYGNATSGVLKSCEASTPAGYSIYSTDCVDNNPNINPNEDEACDSVDNDCDGKIDDADTSVVGQNLYYPDADKDGYGDSSASGSAIKKSCASTAPAGYSANNGDCLDTNNAINPDADEGPGTDPTHYNCLYSDKIDNDCDGQVDENTCGEDDDKDGYTDLQGDCDDASDQVKPGATEKCDTIDQNCDGNPTDSFDADGDGYLSAAKCTFDPRGTDCDDTDKDTFPGATEKCDGKDNDCNPASLDEAIYDYDLDGQLDASSCSGLVTATDCNDADNTIYLGAVEVCDDIDQDCDGLDANGFDTDEDGFLDQSLCALSSDPKATDCDDKDADTYPGALELCNFTDNNCVDGISDEEPDVDGDGVVAKTCDGQDCVDTDASIYPGAQELCDGKNNDCDESYPIDGTMNETDKDKDGFMICEEDCDDQSVQVYPGADEVCDGLDNDCVGEADVGAIDADTWYSDDDGDKHGDQGKPVESCDQVAGIVASSDDCDDADPVVYTGAKELCDGKDNNCDTVADEKVAAFDGDQDGYLDAEQCAALTDATLDCDDGNDQIHPGADEVQGDGVDNNCDGELSVGGAVFQDASLGCSMGGSRQSPAAGWLALLLLGTPMALHRRRRALRG